jgi:hypothetical protein
MASELVESEPMDSDDEVMDRASAFMQAAEMGDDDETAELMAAEGGQDDVHATAGDEDGDTPLMVAVLHGHVDVVRVLLERCADAQVTAVEPKRGMTALLYAVDDDRYNFGEPGWDRAECVRLLLRHSPDAQLAAADDKGVTPLMHASREESGEVVRLLLRHSPDAQVAAVDRDGFPALRVALQWGNAEVVRLLLRHSPEAQVSAVDRWGHTVLINEDDDGSQYGCVVALLRHGRGFVQRDLDKRLMQMAWAVSCMRRETGRDGDVELGRRCIRLLLDRGADPFQHEHPRFYLGAEEELREAIRECAQLAEAPSALNEAAVSVAHARMRIV